MWDLQAMPGKSRQIDVDEAERQYAVSTDIGTGYHGAAGGQEIRLFPGGARLPRNLDMWSREGDDAYPPHVIIDGDLTVDGDFELESGDGAIGFFVLVTGTLRARNVLLFGRPTLIVRGDLIAANGVHGGGEGAGHLVVHGATTARIVVNTTHFRMTFRGPVRALVAGDSAVAGCLVDYPYGEFDDALRPELRNERDALRDMEIADALRHGRPVLRATAVPEHLAARAELDALLDGAAEVTEIDLSHRGLRAVPAQLSAFPNLRKLSLAGNGLIAELPDRIGDLERLEELDLTGTGLTGLPPAIGRLANLRVLDISDNAFRSLPDEIGRLRSLRVLRARSLRCPVPDTLAGLAALEELELELLADDPGVEIPAAVTRLPRLRVLDLSSSALASVPDELLLLTGLEELDLSGALGYVHDLPDLSGLPRLRVLRMPGSRGRNSVPYPDVRLLDRIWGIATLEELTISHWGTQSEYRERARRWVTVRPELDTLPDDAFARMPGLRRLALADNGLSALPRSFYGLKHLEFVNLRRNKLSGARLGLLGKLFPRVRMDLRDNVEVEMDFDDPNWRLVHRLVKEGRAEWSADQALPLFEEAISHCASGAFSPYDRLRAHHGVIRALHRISVPTDSLTPDQTDLLIRHCERALELLPELEFAWHLTDEIAFYAELTREAGNTLAWNLRKRREYQRALPAAERAFRAAEGAEHDYIRDTMVRVLLGLGRADEAYRIVDEVLTRNPYFEEFANLKSAKRFVQWRRANAGP